jgi:hypothetical protein
VDSLKTARLRSLGGRGAGSVRKAIRASEAVRGRVMRRGLAQAGCGARQGSPKRPAPAASSARRPYSPRGCQDILGSDGWRRRSPGRRGSGRGVTVRSRTPASRPSAPFRLLDAALQTGRSFGEAGSRSNESRFTRFRELVGVALGCFGRDPISPRSSKTVRRRPCLSTRRVRSPG